MIVMTGRSLESDAQHVDAEPRQAGHDIPENGHRHQPTLADVAAPARGQDLNLRPSGYERDSTQPADGRRTSCFQFSRAVSSDAESTEVHAAAHESPLVWTRSGQSLPLAQV